MQAGAFFGVLIASYVMDKWGRKAGLIYCSIFSIVGGALLAGSINISMFIVARFFAGMGSWGFLAVSEWSPLPTSLDIFTANPIYTAPVYSAELAPPSLRGLFVGMNGVNIALGYGLASYMGMGMSYHLSRVQDLNLTSMVLLPKCYAMERPTRLGTHMANHDACHHLLRT